MYIVIDIESKTSTMISLFFETNDLAEGPAAWHSEPQ